MKKKIYFALIFTIVGFISLQIPLFKVVGSKTAFTLFDFIAPIAGSFLGLLPAVGSILAIQIVNTLLKGGFVDIGAVIRLFPTLFAVAYFAIGKDNKFSKFILAVPLIAMAAFIAHPVGRSVWAYAQYWWIAVICYFFKDKWLFARSLGATFTAHAVGGALWIWVFNLPAAVWMALIPVVAMERLSMAIGIVIAYRLFVNALYVLEKRHIVSMPFHVEKRFVFDILK